MTVVIGMKFNDKSGAVVADEQVSGSNRKGNTGKKVMVFEKKKSDIGAIVGGSGRMNFLYEIKKKAYKKFQESEVKNIEDFIKILVGETYHLKGKVVEDHFQRKYRLSEEELKTGYLRTKEKQDKKIDSSIIKEYQEYLKHKNEGQELRNGFVALAFDKNELELYKISMSDYPMPTSHPFTMIGSGSDIAHSILSNYVESTIRKTWDNIDPVEGLSIMLHATEEASKRNKGVGGTPWITIYNEGKIIQCSENNSHLAREIVIGEHNSYISKKYAGQALQELLLKGGNFRKIEEQMWNHVSNPDAFDLFLRGYRI